MHRQVLDVVKLRSEVKEAIDEIFVGLLPKEVEAIASRKVEEIETLLQGYISPQDDILKSGLQNFLHLAAFHGYDQIVELLASDAEKINAKDKKGYTPLHLAIAGTQYHEGDFEKIGRTLLHYNANPNIQNNSGFTPLVYAARWHKLSFVKMMLEQPATNPFNKKNRSYLDHLMSNPKEAVDLFIDLIDSPVDIKGILNMSLQASSEATCGIFFNELLMRFYDEKTRKNAGSLILHLDLKYGKFSKLFYSEFLEVAKKSQGSNSLLEAAVAADSTDTFVSAISAKFDLTEATKIREKIRKRVLSQEIKDEKKEEKKEEGVKRESKEIKEVKSSLLTAIEKNDNDDVDKKLSVLTPDEIKSDHLSLCVAIARQSEVIKPKMHIIKALLKSGFDPCQTCDGKAAVHFAAECESFSVLRALVDNKVTKANVNQLTFDGQTALHVAAKNGYVSNIVYLLDNGADPYILTQDGKTFLEIYAENASINNLLSQKRINLDLFKHPEHSQSLLNLIFDRYCKQDKGNDALKSIIVAVAKIYPHSFYKHFKRKEEKFAAEVASSHVANKPMALHKQRRLCAMMLMLETLQNKIVRFHNHRFQFKQPLQAVVTKRIRAIDQELGKSRVEFKR